ncbi:MAG: cysteine desulfurase family protein [Bacteroidota bacterium]
MRIYLDNAATTPLSKEVLDVMLPILKDGYGNPSSIHSEGRKIRTLIEDARKTIAQTIGASIGEIFFTSCGTESNNMALRCAVRDLGVKTIISSKLEHHCVLHCLDSLERDFGTQIIYAPFDEFGRTSHESIDELLKATHEKALVSIMHANNEIGSMNDISSIADICKQHGALFHSDTVQTMGSYPIDVEEGKYSFVSGSAHKFHGPKGVGFIYINGDIHINPFINGGSQERNMRAGTENVYGIAGMAKALSIAFKERVERQKYIIELKSYFKSALMEQIEGIRFNGQTDKGLAKVLSVSFPPSIKSDLLVMQLDMSGISVSGGSACSSGAEAGSHVLSALGLDERRKTIRFSFSKYNTKAEIDKVMLQLKRILAIT